ncbi:MAG: SpoIID/LytB domain-containing protein, partial [Bacteroidota bacterium]
MDSSPNIEVGILKAKRVDFRLAGKFQISGKALNCLGPCLAEISDGKLEVQNEDQNLTFNEEVIFVPCSITSDYFEINDVVIGIDFHWEQRETQKFQGALKLLVHEGEIQVINVIPIENYLISVISSEMSANSSLELLKAHAIISRSWMMAQMRRNSTL